MKDYQSDKYENFFLNLRTSRDGLATFGDFTATAVAAPGVDALVAGHGAALTAALAALRTDIVARRAQGGGSQTGTSTEKTAFTTFKTFIQATEKKVLGPYLYDHADEHATYYPDDLSGLTQALVDDRLTRLTAYTQALESAPDKTVKAQGAPARALLAAYTLASTAKTKSRTAVQDTIADLGPLARTVAEALWDVHTAAVYVHRRRPMDARKYFDYASLPNRVNKKPTTTSKPA